MYRREYLSDKDEKCFPALIFPGHRIFFKTILHRSLPFSVSKDNEPHERREIFQTTKKTAAMN